MKVINGSLFQWPSLCSKLMCFCSLSWVCPVESSYPLKTVYYCVWYYGSVFPKQVWSSCGKYLVIIIIIIVYFIITSYSVYSIAWWSQYWLIYHFDLWKIHIHIKKKSYCMSLYYFKVYGLLLEYWLSNSSFVDFF